MQEYVAMWTNYFNFGGRTTRRGYWMAYLFNFIVAFVLGLVASFVPALSFLASIYALAILIPSLAIIIRRLRDAGKGWGWIFINFVPLIGQIIFLVFLCSKSVPAATNGYTNGYDPYAN